MKIKNKKAQAYIEVIVSFVIFTGFLLFLFVFFNPLKQPVGSNLIGSVFDKLDERLEISMKSISIDLDKLAIGGDFDSITCFELDNVDLISDLDCGSSRVVVKVKDAYGGDDGGVSGGVSGNSLYFQKGPSDNVFYTISCSEEFEVASYSDSCFNLQSEHYKLGIVVERILWSESKLTELKSAYDSQYRELKGQILPGSNDFALVILENNGGPVGEDTPEFEMKPADGYPQGREVYSEVISIQTIKDNGNIIQRGARITIW